MFVHFVTAPLLPLRPVEDSLRQTHNSELWGLSFLHSDKNFCPIFVDASQCARAQKEITELFTEAPDGELIHCDDASAAVRRRFLPITEELGRCSAFSRSLPLHLLAARSPLNSLAKRLSCLLTYEGK